MGKISQATKRTVAGFLAALMVVSSFPTSVYAEDDLLLDAQEVTEAVTEAATDELLLTQDSEQSLTDAVLANDSEEVPDEEELLIEEDSLEIMEGEDLDDADGEALELEDEGLPILSDEEDVPEVATTVSRPTISSNVSVNVIINYPVSLEQIDSSYTSYNEIDGYNYGRLKNYFNPISVKSDLQFNDSWDDLGKLETKRERLTSVDKITDYISGNYYNLRNASVNTVENKYIGILTPDDGEHRYQIDKVYAIDSLSRNILTSDNQLVNRDGVVLLKNYNKEVSSNEMKDRDFYLVSVNDIAEAFDQEDVSDNCIKEIYLVTTYKTINYHTLTFRLFNADGFSFNVYEPKDNADGFTKEDIANGKTSSANMYPVTVAASNLATDYSNESADGDMTFDSFLKRIAFAANDEGKTYLSNKDWYNNVIRKTTSAKEYVYEALVRDGSVVEIDSSMIKNITGYVDTQVYPTWDNGELTSCVDLDNKSVSYNDYDFETERDEHKGVFTKGISYNNVFYVDVNNSEEDGSRIIYIDNEVPSLDMYVGDGNYGDKGVATSYEKYAYLAEFKQGVVASENGTRGKKGVDSKSPYNSYDNYKYDNLKATGSENIVVSRKANYSFDTPWIKDKLAYKECFKVGKDYKFQNWHIAYSLKTVSDGKVVKDSDELIKWYEFNKDSDIAKAVRGCTTECTIDAKFVKELMNLMKGDPDHPGYVLNSFKVEPIYIPANSTIKIMLQYPVDVQDVTGEDYDYKVVTFDENKDNCLIDGISYDNFDYLEYFNCLTFNRTNTNESKGDNTPQGSMKTLNFYENPYDFSISFNEIGTTDLYKQVANDGELLETYPDRTRYAVGFTQTLIDEDKYLWFQPAKLEASMSDNYLYKITDIKTISSNSAFENNEYLAGLYDYNYSAYRMTSSNWVSIGNKAYDLKNGENLWYVDLEYMANHDDYEEIYVQVERVPYYDVNFTVYNAEKGFSYTVYEPNLSDIIVSRNVTVTATDLKEYPNSYNPKAVVAPNVFNKYSTFDAITDANPTDYCNSKKMVRIPFNVAKGGWIEIKQDDINHDMACYVGDAAYSWSRDQQVNFYHSATGTVREYENRIVRSDSVIASANSAEHDSGAQYYLEDGRIAEDGVIRREDKNGKITSYNVAYGNLVSIDRIPVDGFVDNPVTYGTNHEKNRTFGQDGEKVYSEPFDGSDSMEIYLVNRRGYLPIEQEQLDTDYTGTASTNTVSRATVNFVTGANVDKLVDNKGAFANADELDTWVTATEQYGIKNVGLYYVTAKYQDDYKDYLISICSMNGKPLSENGITADNFDDVDFSEVSFNEVPDIHKIFEFSRVELPIKEDTQNNNTHYVVDQEKMLWLIEHTDIRYLEKGDDYVCKMVVQPKYRNLVELYAYKQSFELNHIVSINFLSGVEGLCQGGRILGDEMISLNVIPEEGYTVRDVYFLLYDNIGTFTNRNLSDTLSHEGTIAGHWDEENEAFYVSKEDVIKLTKLGEHVYVYALTTPRIKAVQDPETIGKATIDFVEGTTSDNHYLVDNSDKLVVSINAAPGYRLLGAKYSIPGTTYSCEYAYIPNGDVKVKDGYLVSETPDADILSGNLVLTVSKDYIWNECRTSQNRLGRELFTREYTWDGLSVNKAINTFKPEFVITPILAPLPKAVQDEATKEFGTVNFLSGVRGDENYITTWTNGKAGLSQNSTLSDDKLVLQVSYNTTKYIFNGEVAYKGYDIFGNVVSGNLKMVEESSGDAGVSKDSVFNPDYTSAIKAQTGVSKLFTFDRSSLSKNDITKEELALILGGQDVVFTPQYTVKANLAFTEGTLRTTKSATFYPGDIKQEFKEYERTISTNGACTQFYTNYFVQKQVPMVIELEKGFELIKDSNNNYVVSYNTVLGESGYISVNRVSTSADYIKFAGSNDDIEDYLEYFKRNLDQDHYGQVYIGYVPEDIVKRAELNEDCIYISAGSDLIKGTEYVTWFETSFDKDITVFTNQRRAVLTSVWYKKEELKAGKVGGIEYMYLYDSKGRVLAEYDYRTYPYHNESLGVYGDIPQLYYEWNDNHNYENIVLANAPSKPGTYYMRAYLVGTSESNPKYTTTKFKVVQGIKGMSVSDKIVYKNAKKKLTIKNPVTYGAKPKIKKVLYSIDWDGYSGEVDEAIAQANITIDQNNGKITVNKGFDAKSGISLLCKVEPNDYREDYHIETETTWFSVEIYTEQPSISEIKLYDWEKYEYLDRNTNYEIGVGDVYRYSVYAITGGNYEIPSGHLTYKSSNKKVLTVDAYGNITPVGVGKAKVTIKSGKNSNYIWINVKNPENIGVQLLDATTLRGRIELQSGYSSTSKEQVYVNSMPTDAFMKLRVYDADKEPTFNSNISYSVKVKGGKLVKAKYFTGMFDYGTYAIYPTAATTKVTVKLANNESRVLTIYNRMYNTQKNDVKLDGVVYGYSKVNAYNEYDDGYELAQSVSFITNNPSAKRMAVSFAYDKLFKSEKDFYNYRDFLRAFMDDDTLYFMSMFKPMDYELDLVDGKATIDFTNVPVVGDYAFKIQLLDDEGNAISNVKDVILKCKKAPIAKVSAAKSAKIAGVYNEDIANAFGTEGTPNGEWMTTLGIKNKNTIAVSAVLMNKREKNGVINNFTDYFAIEGDYITVKKSAADISKYDSKGIIAVEYVDMGGNTYYDFLPITIKVNKKTGIKNMVPALVDKMIEDVDSDIITTWLADPIVKAEINACIQSIYGSEYSFDFVYKKGIIKATYNANKNQLSYSYEVKKNNKKYVSGTVKKTIYNELQ